MDKRTLGLINGVRHMECPDPAYACEIQYRDRTGNFPFQVFFLLKSPTGHWFIH